VPPKPDDGRYHCVGCSPSPGALTPWSVLDPRRYRDTLLDRARSHLSDPAEAAERERPDVDVELQFLVGI
jgi:hypothetical protein